MRYCSSFALSFVSFILRESVAGFADRAPAFDVGRRAVASTGHLTSLPRRASVPVRPRRRQISSLLAKFDRGDENDDKDRRDAFARNQKRTDVRLFLTQRAIQSFVHLLLETRDPHTVRWIETNYDAPNLDQFHGTAVFNYTKWEDWDSIFQDMLSKPKEVVIVATKSRGRPNNPYYEDRVVEFEIPIDPVSLVSRIVSVRIQLATEWMADIGTMVVANEAVLESYHENLANARDVEGCSTPDDGALEDPFNCVDAEHFASSLTNPNDGAPLRGAFERSAQTLLNNAIAFDERASSPLRKRNFDLLLLLATQESVHRVLRQYRDAGSERQVSFEWFREYYASRVADFFDGCQPVGRADDFLESLLTMPPSMKTSDDRLELVDPLRIAEDLIRTRSEVCADWKETIRDVVPLEHMELRKLILDCQMGKRQPREQDGPAREEAKAGRTDDSSLYGEFE